VSTTNTESTGTAQESTAAASAEFKAPATQEELNAIIEGRLSRERAKYSDYSDLKAKASKFEEAEEEKKSELEKVATKAQKAEERALKAEQLLLKSEVAREKGVPVALLVGSTKEELEAYADGLIAFRGETTNSEEEPAGATSTALRDSGNPLPLNGDPLENALRSRLNIR
jgi:hypothetical protein